MADTVTATGPPQPEAAPTDEAREAVLATLTDALGDELVGHHIAPGRGLWIRVTRDAWGAAAEHAKARLGFHPLAPGAPRRHRRGGRPPPVPAHVPAGQRAPARAPPQRGDQDRSAGRR